jgi:hypothetical protein
MKLPEILFTAAQPCMHVVQTEAHTFHGLRAALRQQHPQAVVQIVRGHKALTAGSFFDEFYAAFQLAPYCGENWNAFEECATDLRRASPAPHLVMVSHASSLLRDAGADAFGMLLTLLGRVHEAWGSPEPHLKLPSLSWHVLLQESPASMSGLQERLRSAGIAYDEIAV